MCDKLQHMSINNYIVMPIHMMQGAIKSFKAVRLTFYFTQSVTEILPLGTLDVG